MNSADSAPNFSQDTNGLVIGPTAAEVSGNRILQADNTWIVNPLAGFVGTQGSVIFVGASGQLTQDNDKLYFDDASDELGINVGTDPQATLHIARDVSTGKVFRGVRSGLAETEEAFYFGDDGANADFLITGDGRVGVGEAESTLNAKFRIRSSNTTAAMIIDSNDTGSSYGLQIDHEGTTQDACEITSAVTTGSGLDVQCDSVTSGRIAYFRSSSSSAVNRVLVECRNSNVSATGAIPLVAHQAAAGMIAEFRNVSSATIFGFYTGGYQVYGALPSTDTAPQDDTTAKRLSLQRLSSAPTNAAYIQFTNSPGGTANFYLVLEEES